MGRLHLRTTYSFAIDDFISWYCSQPQTAQSKTRRKLFRIQEISDGKANQTSVLSLNELLALPMPAAWDSERAEAEKLRVELSSAFETQGARSVALEVGGGGVQRPPLRSRRRTPSKC